MEIEDSSSSETSRDQDEESGDEGAPGQEVLVLKREKDSPPKKGKAEAVRDASQKDRARKVRKRRRSREQDGREKSTAR